ncbi:MAG: hypothetical protein QOH80_168 [Actinomycetota bacterium]|nr:hypothetical protein [Actinomycetota bacterium]
MPIRSPQPRHDARMRSERWPRRQGTALLGMVPIVALFAGVGLGGLVAKAVGVPDWIGALLGAVAGFFLSRWVLRLWFAERA